MKMYRVPIIMRPTTIQMGGGQKTILQLFNWGALPPAPFSYATEM